MSDKICPLCNKKVRDYQTEIKIGSRTYHNKCALEHAMNSTDVEEVKLYYETFKIYYEDTWPFATSLEHIKRHYEYLKDRN